AFVATAANGAELFLFNGVSTQEVDIRPGGTGSAPVNLTASNNLVFFSADNGTVGRELWVTNGTLVGTHLVQDLFSAGNSANPSFLVPFGTGVAFTATGSTYG